jgi:hypothetical protein
MHQLHPVISEAATGLRPYQLKRLASTLAVSTNQINEWLYMHRVPDKYRVEFGAATLELAAGFQIGELDVTNGARKQCALPGCNAFFLTSPFHAGNYQKYCTAKCRNLSRRPYRIAWAKLNRRRGKWAAGARAVPEGCC